MDQENILNESWKTDLIKYDSKAAILTMKLREGAKTMRNFSTAM